MGNKIVTPFPTYENAQKALSVAEVMALRERFRLLCCKDNINLTLANFTQIQSVNCTQYIRRFILLRIFTVIDTKKNGIIDFEEFLCAVALFRNGSIEDRTKFFFLMYEPVKGGYLTRDQLRQTVVDAYLSNQKDPLPSRLEDMLLDLRELADGMVDTVLYQFAAQDGKVDFQEFFCFVQAESSMQSFMKILQSLVDVNIP